MSLKSWSTIPIQFTSEMSEKASNNKKFIEYSSLLNHFRSGPQRVCQLRRYLLNLIDIYTNPKMHHTWSLLTTHETYLQYSIIF